MIRSLGHECHFAEVQSGDIRRWRHISLDQSEPTSRHATRSAERTSICERTQCGAQRKHVNIIRSHGHECHFAEVQSGDIRRWRTLSLDQSEPTSRHSTRGTADGIKDVCLHFLAFHSMTQCRMDVESW